MTIAQPRFVRVRASQPEGRAQSALGAADTKSHSEETKRAASAMDTLSSRQAAGEQVGPTGAASSGRSGASSSARGSSKGSESAPEHTPAPSAHLASTGTASTVATPADRDDSARGPPGATPSSPTKNQPAVTAGAAGKPAGGASAAVRALKEDSTAPSEAIGLPPVDHSSSASARPPTHGASGRQSPSGRQLQSDSLASTGSGHRPSSASGHSAQPSQHPMLTGLFSQDARSVEPQAVAMGRSNGGWLFGHRRANVHHEILELREASKFAARYARLKEERKAGIKPALPSAAEDGGGRHLVRTESRTGTRGSFSSPTGAAAASLQDSFDTRGRGAHGKVDWASLLYSESFMHSVTTAPPTVIVPSRLLPLVCAPDAPPFGGVGPAVDMAYLHDTVVDPLDSARSQLAVDMTRVAMEAVARDLTFVVSGTVVGSFADSTDRALPPPASTPSQRGAAKPAASEAKEAKADPPAPIRFASKAEERAARRSAKRAAKRARALERERAREAEERRLMQAEEWHSQRAVWWKGHSLDSSWRTVRVFVSSTFNDFHGERDALTRVVFPALNNRAKSRRVRVVPVDLRWGLTSEDTSDSGLGALEHCLLEIEKSRPFFLALLGERYGWIPPNYRVSETKEFQWCNTFEPGHSITAMEIYHGFLRKWYQPVHAIVYNRDPEFIKDISDEKDERGWSDRGVFAWDYPDKPDVLARRNQLRQDCQDHPYCKYRTYAPQYGGKDEEGKPTVTGLAEFEKGVLDDLWAAIKAEFPPPPPPPSALAAERAYHTHFLENRAEQFIGRRKLIKRLEEVADQDHAKNTLPFIVVGAPGSGKTSLVTAFAKQYIMSSRRAFVLVHVVSASPSSTDIREVLLRLCHEMAERFHLERASKLDENDDYQSIKDVFSETLTEAGRAAMLEGTHVLLVIDAINQLNTFYGAHTMDWCPPYSPPGVITILSATPDSAPLAALLKRDPCPDQLIVPGLMLEERKEIVRTSLLEYSKRLKTEQMDLIMAKPESTKPLYLLTVCEELRLQAQYGIAGTGVDHAIRNLPGEIPDLLDVVLLRVERDLSTWAEHAGGEELAPSAMEGAAARGDASTTPGADASPDATAASGAGAGGAAIESKTPSAGSAQVSSAVASRVGYYIVRDALSLLVCSRHGLSEDELLEMLAPDGRARLPPVVWARLYRSLELYLRPMGDDAQGLLGFFHEQMVFAVQRRYLDHRAKLAVAVSARLLDYFSSRADPLGTLSYNGTNIRYMQDLVHYQLRAHRYAELYRTLGCVQFIQRRAFHGPGSMEHLLRDYHDAMEDVRNVKFQSMKEGMARAGERTPESHAHASSLSGQGYSEEHADTSGSSRGSLLQWLGEFLVFVGSSHAAMVEYPWLTMQHAANQPTLSAPARVAAAMVAAEEKALVKAMDERTLRIKELAAAEWARLVEPILAKHAPPPSGRSGRSGRVRGQQATPISSSDGQDTSRSRSGSVTSQSDRQAARREAVKAELASATRLAPLWPLQHPPSARGQASPSRRRSSSASTPGGALNTFWSASAHGIRKRLQHLASATAWALRRVSFGLKPEAVPRRYLDWQNKPRRNLIVADFAGYSSKVTALALSPDAEHIAVGFQDGTLHIVDAGTGESVRECSTGGHVDAITCLQYSADGLRLVSGSFDCQVIIWDALTGQPHPATLRTLAAPTCPGPPPFTGTRLCGMDDHDDIITAAVWLDAEQPKLQATPHGRRPRKSLAAKSALQHVVIYSGHQYVHAPPPFAPFTASTRLLATASMDASLIIWEEKRSGRYGSRGRTETAKGAKAERRERRRQDRERSGQAFSGDQLNYDVMNEISKDECPVLSLTYDCTHKVLFMGMMRDGVVNVRSPLHRMSPMASQAQICTLPVLHRCWIAQPRTWAS